MCCGEVDVYKRRVAYQNVPPFQLGQLHLNFKNKTLLVSRAVDLAIATDCRADDTSCSFSHI